jgi:hypothetical protein
MAYSPEERLIIQQRLCAEIAAGSSVSKACKLDGMPAKKVIFEWLLKEPEFGDQYTRAREARADARADRIDEIVEKIESGTLGYNEARVIIDAEKWQAGKENSKRYGDKVSLDGDMTMRLTDEQLGSRAAQLLGKAGVVVVARGAGSAPEGAQDP